MKSKPISRRLVAIVLAAAFAGAVLGVPAQAQTAPRKPFRVVTTFTIIQDIAQNVAGDRAIVESITKPGAEIHDYQPTPLDIVRAQAADLVLWNGFNLERWFHIDGATGACIVLTQALFFILAFLFAPKCGILMRTRYVSDASLPDADT
jgi:ABC-type Zn2+ transport system substrate-binding protein/surface adhesin